MFKTMLDNVREKCPLIHNITNYVTVNDCANVLLACGGSPIMSTNGTAKWFYGKRINNPNTHGTGCTLSSAIASNLAKGYSLEESVERARNYISGALAAMLDLGNGSGPMNHAFCLKND